MVVTTGDIGGYIEFLKGLKAGVDENTIPAINWKEIRPFLAMEHFTVEIIQSKNSAAAGVCSFVLNIVMVRAMFTSNLCFSRKCCSGLAMDSLCTENVRLCW